jgi:hypothetical protein
MALKRRYTYRFVIGMEKVLKSLIIREMQIKTNEISPGTCQNGYYQVANLSYLGG